MILGPGVWGWWILGRNAGWLPPLRWIVLVVTVAATVALLVSLISEKRRRFATVSLAVGLIGALAGSGAYALATIGQSHSGGMVLVGPASSDSGAGAWWQDADNPQLEALLRTTHTKWSAAINRSSPAAALELSTNTAVMAIGGFGGLDPTPTLSEFQADVASHQLTYYIAPVSGRAPGGFGGQQHNDINTWVKANFTPTTIGSDTIYNLTTP